MKTVIYITPSVDPIRMSGYSKLDILYGVKCVVKHVTVCVEEAFAEMDGRKPRKPSARMEIRRKIEIGSSRIQVGVLHARTHLYSITCNSKYAVTV